MITFNHLYSTARRNSHRQSCPRFVSNRWSNNSTVKRLTRKRVLELLDPCFEGVSYVFSSHRAWRIATNCLSNHLFELSPPATSHRIVDYQRQACTRSIPISIYRSTSNSSFRMDIINEVRFRLKSDFLQSSFNLLVSFYRIRYDSEWNTILERRSDFEYIKSFIQFFISDSNLSFYSISSYLFI